MVSKKIFSDFCLVGEDLDLKKNVIIEISKNGIIKGINESEKINNKNPLGKGKTILLPGFINSHIHIADSIGKEFGLNKPIKDVVSGPNSLKYKLLRDTDENLIIKGIREAVNEMLSNGITFFIDFREFGIKGIKLLKKALKDSPIKFKILGRQHENDDVFDIYNIADGIGFPSSSKIDRDIIKNILNKKPHTNKIIATHISEVKRENIILENILSEDFIDVFIHGTHFNKQDLLKIKKHNKKIVICPQSNGYFGMGIPPLKEMLDMKLEISIGTDNIMAIRPDLFEEMRYLYKVSKIRNPNYVLKSRDLLKMVTINAAKNFRLDKEIGSISVGKFADFFLINLKDSNFFTVNHKNLLDLTVHRTTSFNIKKVYIKGRVVFEK